MIAAFEANGHEPHTRPGPRGRPHLDLAAANRDQLLAAGLDPARLHDAALCTRCNAAFHSYRREGGPTGRNWAFAIAGPEQRLYSPTRVRATRDDERGADDA